jgi:hypothetical protein
MVDPTGLLLTGIRDAPAVAALTDRVRCPEPMGKSVSADGILIDAGDSRGPGTYIRFIVLTRLGRRRENRVPVQAVRYIAKCYGLNAQDAEAIAGAVSDAVHNVGLRRNASGVLIFQSFEDGGEGATNDPDTGQAMAAIVISVTAATVAVPIG